jgi:cytochrome c oxidase subunit 3
MPLSGFCQIVSRCLSRLHWYSERYHAPITVAGLYWHFVDLVWVVLFALIYLPGRSA